MNVAIWEAGAYADLPQVKAFMQEYTARMSGDQFPSGYVALTARVIDVLVRAIANAGTDPEKLIPYIESNSFPSLKGDVRYRAEDHVSLTDVDIIRIEANDSAAGIEVSERHRYRVAEFTPPPNPGKPFAG